MNEVNEKLVSVINWLIEIHDLVRLYGMIISFLLMGVIVGLGLLILIK